MKRNKKLLALIKAYFLCMGKFFICVLDDDEENRNFSNVKKEIYCASYEWVCIIQGVGGVTMELYIHNIVVVSFVRFCIP